eukprot:COSAG04_NODE_17690_length_461_cov_5.528571_2_plen_31_part_01
MREEDGATHDDEQETRERGRISERSGREVME